MFFELVTQKTQISPFDVDQGKTLGWFTVAIFVYNFVGGWRVII